MIDIKLKKNILFGLGEETREQYIKFALDFFNEIHFDNRNEIVSILNKLKGKYANNLLFALSFYQYAEENINQKDSILRPVLLTCLIDGIEEQKCISDDVKIFLKRLDNKDKLYLLNNFEILQARGKNKGFKRLYNDLLTKNKIYKHLPDTDYQQIDEKLKRIDKYINILAEHFCKIRHFVLHEAKAVPSVAFIDDTYGIVSTFFGYLKKNNKNKKTYKHLYTKISLEEFRKIVKRGVMEKICKSIKISG